MDLNYTIRGLSHTHTTAGTAEEISCGLDDGAIVELFSKTAACFVGGTKLEAEAHKAGTPEGVPLEVQLKKNTSTFWLDGGTSDTITITQVSTPE